jgi:hypothetical protein
MDTLRTSNLEASDEFTSVGGANFGHYAKNRRNYNKVLKAAMKEAANDKNTILGPLSSLWESYDNLAKGSEKIGRLAEYNRAKAKALRQGMSEYDARLWAAFQARGLLDFAVGGRITKMISRFYPFTNAQVQGIVRLMKAARTDPVKLGMRWGMYVLIPEIISYVWNTVDPDDEEEFQNLPDYQRDMFWNFKVAPDMWLRLPKPWEIGVMASGVTRTIDAARGREDAFAGWWGNMSRSILPLDETAILGPYQAFAEAATNYDLFRDRNIVPAYEQAVPVEDRKGTSRASRLGQLLQKALGIDARKIDHIIEGQFAGLGRIGTSASNLGQPGFGGTDILVRSLGITSISPASWSQDTQKLFTLMDEYGIGATRDVRELYDLFEEWRQLPSGQERDAKAAEIRQKSRLLIDQIGDELPGRLAYRLSQPDPSNLRRDLRNLRDIGLTDSEIVKSLRNDLMRRAKERGQRVKPSTIARRMSQLRRNLREADE